MPVIVLADFCEPVAIESICREFGLGIEIQSFYDPDVYESQPKIVAEQRELFRDLSPVAFHGPFAELFPGALDSLIRGACWTRLNDGLAFASRLGATHVIFHNNYIPGTARPADYVKRAAAFWRDFLAAHPGDFEIHLENHLERDPAVLADLIDAVDDPRLSVNLDLGHVHCYSKLPPLEWIGRLGTRIRYAHIHDNRGEADEHLALGTGTVPLAEALGALAETAPDAIWSVEVRSPDARASLDWLRDREFLD